MFTGDPRELREKEQRARQIAAQIASLLNELEDIAPGSVTTHGGQITGLAVTIRRSGSSWTAR